MPKAQLTALTVLATAGEWSTVNRLVRLEQELLGTDSCKGQLKVWTAWIAEWREAELLEVSQDQQHTLYFRLSHEIRHHVLAASPRSRLQNFADVLARNYWSEAHWLGLARLALYLGQDSLFVETMGQTHNEDAWLRLLGAVPLPEAFSLVPETQKEKLLRILGDRALELEGVPAEVLLTQSNRWPPIASRFTAFAEIFPRLKLSFASSHLPQTRVAIRMQQWRYSTLPRMTAGKPSTTRTWLCKRPRGAKRTHHSLVH